MAILTLITVLIGITGVINAISYVVPFLLGFVFFIAIYNFLNNPVTLEELQALSAISGAAPNWIISNVVDRSYIFSIVLFAEVYTTAVGSLYGFVQRLVPNSSKYKRWIIFGATILAFGVSQFGFSTMVKYLYPAVGYGGMLMFLGLIWVWFTKREDLN